MKLTTDLVFHVLSGQKNGRGSQNRGEPAAAPLTDEEKMVKYWKNFKNPKGKIITVAFVFYKVKLSSQLKKTFGNFFPLF